MPHQQKITTVMMVVTGEPKEVERAVMQLTADAADVREEREIGLLMRTVSTRVECD